MVTAELVRQTMPRKVNLFTPIMSYEEGLKDLEKKILDTGQKGITYLDIDLKGDVWYYRDKLKTLLINQGYSISDRCHYKMRISWKKL